MKRNERKNQERRGQEKEEEDGKRGEARTLELSSRMPPRFQLTYLNQQGLIGMCKFAQ